MARVYRRRAILLRMNFALLLLMCTFMQISLAADAQKITIQKQNASLEYVLSEINRQTGYEFLYTREMMKETRVLDVHLKNQLLDDALKQVFRNQPLTYSINARTIVIRRKEAAVATERRPPVTIRGKVTDQANKPIPGVSVSLQGTTVVTTTDADGNYTITIPDGNGTLEFRYIGFSTKVLDVGGRTVVDVQLGAETTDLSEVVVVGYGTQKKVNLTGAISTVTSEEITDVQLGRLPLHYKA